MVGKVLYLLYTVTNETVLSKYCLPQSHSLQIPQIATNTRVEAGNRVGGPLCSTVEQ